jgi:hypothetical protein
VCVKDAMRPSEVGDKCKRAMDAVVQCEVVDSSRRCAGSSAYCRRYVPRWYCIGYSQHGPRLRAPIRQVRNKASTYEHSSRCSRVLCVLASALGGTVGSPLFMYCLVHMLAQVRIGCPAQAVYFCGHDMLGRLHGLYA